MFSCATLMNCRSVAEHVCATAARLLPPRKRTSEAMATIATASPAAAVKRGFTVPVSAAQPPTLHTPFGYARFARKRAPGLGLRLFRSLEDEASVGAVLLHPDPLIDPDCRGVLGADEQA